MSEDLNRHNQDHSEQKEDDEAKQENDQMGMQSGEIGKRLPPQVNSSIKSLDPNMSD